MIVATAGAAERLLAPMFASTEVERVVVLHLGTGRALIAVTLEETGGDAEVELPVGRILARALTLGAAGIIVAHNHPSGQSSPSAADRLATDALERSAAQVGIRLYDHLIFGGPQVQSFVTLVLL